MAQRTRAKKLFYDLVWVFSRLVGLIVFRVRWRDAHYVPATGGALVLSTHQSYLDPVLIGLACNRRLNFIARETLFGFAPFRWLIQSLDAIPIDREGMGLSGLKETLRRVRSDEAVLIFPEGTRTPDGEIQRLKGGFAALARRSHAPLVPVAIEGAFQCWPRSRRYPLPGRIDVQFGPPLEPEQIAQLDDQQLIEEVESRLQACLAKAREYRARRRPSGEGRIPHDE